MVSQIPGPGATGLSSEERKLLSTGEEGAYEAARCDAGTGVHAPADVDLGVECCMAWHGGRSNLWTGLGLWRERIPAYAAAAWTGAWGAK